jgi:hypothetical protein
MNDAVSRRRFLQVAGTSAAAIYAPTSLNGYTAAEMNAKTVDGTVLGVGVSK